MPNNLEHAKSPYLRQHADNPVEWHEWGEEAFAKAAEEDKPVFLSIGYATCHWCHVMAHESFEDEEIAGLMNEAFINIKLDREERPDIDSMYMTVCQMITGHGGWPLNVILTPDKKPFYASTYIPKDSRPERIGMRQLIPGITGMWENERDKIDKAREKITEGFRKSQDYKGGKFPGTEAYDYAAEQLARGYDSTWGGFGQAPKFPSPHNYMFLLRQWKISGDKRFLDIVTHSLKKMRLGGLWDHIGFGFHRYSTDRQWVLPHFEKMLYDQALLMMAYTEAWQVTGEPLFRQTVYEIAEYVKRNMTSEQGGFYSAEDADSESEEGKFYIWSEEEINALLDNDTAVEFMETFSFKNGGNFLDEATGQQTGTNIPYLRDIPSESKQQWIDEVRKTLFNVREKRIRPLLDDKILTDWNGLMMAALAKAGAAFNEPLFTESAENCWDFIQENLREADNLMHRHSKGEAGIDGMADDYASMIWAAIELYECTGNPDYLGSASDLQHSFDRQFADEEKGGYILSSRDEDQVLGRQKQIYDGAQPSSNSMSFLNLFRLSRLTGDSAYEDQALAIGKCFSEELIRNGSSITHSMQAIQFMHSGSEEIIICTDKNQTPEIRQEIQQYYSPFSVYHIIDSANREAINQLAPYTSSMHMEGQETVLYRCRNFACDQPVTGLEQVIKSLQN